MDPLDSNFNDPRELRRGSKCQRKMVPCEIPKAVDREFRSRSWLLTT